MADRGVDVVRSVRAVRDACDEARRSGASIGLVPTMGALHDGHTSLVASARSDTDLVLTTIFVNPLQFGDGEDLGAYPRDEEGDVARAAAAGTDLVFAPPVENMYPEPMRTTVSVPSLAADYEGHSRPTHFDGVATVVAKLFGIVGPCRAYFGEKDYQQLVIVRRVAADLSVPVEVVGCPTVREPDGLAMSSRNVYLSPEEREAAPVLHRALLAGKAATRAGAVDLTEVRDLMADIVTAEPLAELDYVAVVDAETLAPVSERDRQSDPAALRFLGAAAFGRARLIDNV